MAVSSSFSSIPVSQSTIKCLSYNLHGLNQGSSLLSTLVSNLSPPDFLFIQESWLTPDNLWKILNFNKNYTGFGISAMEHMLSKKILRGRAHGGTAILVNNSVIKKVKCIKCAERYVVITFEHYVLINVYLPDRSVEGCDDIIINVLSEIGVILSSHADKCFVFGGDFNTDMSGHRPAAEIIKSFMLE